MDFIVSTILEFLLYGLWTSTWVSLIVALIVGIIVGSIVWAIAISPDNRTLASALENEIKLWQLP